MVVPASLPADTVLEEIRAARQQIAVVADEFGGTAGIVTLENLIEALVGRIEDDSRPRVGFANEPVPEPDGSLVFDGLTRLEELEERLGVQIESQLREEVDTVGGLMMAALGRVPEAGDQVEVDGHVFRVEALDGRRVAAVRLLAA
jgi:CBS domain containing-hemolysin-like protein